MSNEIERRSTVAKDQFDDNIANYVDFEDKVLNDELKAFRSYGVAYIPCLYSKGKAETFKKLVAEAGMKYTYSEYDVYAIFIRTDRKKKKELYPVY